MEAVQRYGWKDVKSIAQHVGTRTPTQVRTHAQKLFLRQQKESSGIMAPAKNGRSEGLPPLPGRGLGGPSDMGGDQLQALQEAGYHLAEQQMGDLGGADGSGGMAVMGNVSNPDAAPGSLDGGE